MQSKQKFGEFFLFFFHFCSCIYSHAQTSTDRFTDIKYIIVNIQEQNSTSKKKLKFLVKGPFTHFCVSLERSLAVPCDTSKRELGFGCICSCTCKKKNDGGRTGKIRKIGEEKKENERTRKRRIEDRLDKA